MHLLVQLLASVVRSLPRPLELNKAKYFERTGVCRKLREEARGLHYKDSKSLLFRWLGYGCRSPAHSPDRAGIICQFSAIPNLCVVQILALTWTSGMLSVKEIQKGFWKERPKACAGSWYRGQV